MSTGPQKILQLDVSNKRYPYLLDHKIGNNRIIPATLYLEAMLSLGLKKYGLPLLLKNIRYARALSVNADENYPMGVLTEEKNASIECQIILAHEHSLCASATIEPLQPPKLEPIDINQIISRCPEKKEKKAYYDYMAQYNLNFGPKHQGLNFIRIGQDEAIAQLEILPENKDPEFFAHPSFLDTFSHVGLFALSDLSRTQIYVTADQERIELYQKFPDKVWCHSKIVRREKNEIFVDLHVYTLDGILIEKIINYRLKVIEQFLLLPEKYLFYALGWNKVTLKHQDKIPEPKFILFSGEENPFLGPVASKINKIDLEKSIEISDPANTSLIFYAKNENTDIFESNAAALNQLLKLSQALSNLHGVELHRFIVLYEDDLKYASLSGFCHVINQEMPNLKLQQILVDSESKLEDCVMDALSQPYENQALKYEKNEAQAFRLMPIYEPSKNEPFLQEAGTIENVGGARTGHPERRRGISLNRLGACGGRSLGCARDDDGSYLITGGLGGIGLSLAHYFIKMGAKQIILLHRSEITAAQKTALDKLNEAQVRVIPLQCDILDPEGLKQVIQKIHNAPYPLKGIFHAAGTTKDNLISKLSASDIDFVLKPKLQGAMNLHEVSKEIGLDYFVLFSSVTSFLGTKGVANYAAANAFLNEFAVFRQKQGLPATSINWGPWAEGMLSKLGEKVIKSWEEQGFKILSGDEGAQDMIDAMRMPYPKIAVMPVDWSILLSKYTADDNCTALTDIRNALGLHFEGGQLVSDILPNLQSAEPENRMDLLTDYLLEKIQKITGSTLSDLDLSFTRFGIDSITAIEFSSQLERDFQTSIPQTLVYNYPNILSLAEYLIAHKIDFSEKKMDAKNSEAPEKATEELSDEDLSKLLDQELKDLDDLK